MASDDTPGASYDRIGRGYAKIRRPDSRLAELIADALGMPKQLSTSVRERVRTSLTVDRS
jgi:hypothetical protein